MGSLKWFSLPQFNMPEQSVLVTFDVLGNRCLEVPASQITQFRVSFVYHGISPSGIDLVISQARAHQAIISADIHRVISPIIVLLISNVTTITPK